MNPLLFGSRERPLFGIHSPPGANRKRHGAIICPPWGPEYQRAHRASRQLGERLVLRGFDVFRFDYFGTGDSGGGAEDVTLAGCVLDTHAAIDELTALADVRSVMLVGLRFGAAVARRAAATNRAVDRLALWDPIVSGSAWLEELATAGGADGVQVGGYPMGPNLRTELSRLTALDEAPVRAHVLVVASDENAGLDAMVGRMRPDARSIEHAVRPAPPAWKEEAALGVGAIPVDVLELIADWSEQTHAR